MTDTLPPSPAPAPAAPPRPGAHTVMWVALAGIAVTVVLALTVGVRFAAFFFAAELAALAVLRAVRPAPGPYGISARSRTFDVSWLALLAAGIGLLAAFTANL